MSADRVKISELTNVKLRRMIAKLQGITQITKPFNDKPHIWIGTYPDGETRRIPNWPGNIGAAYELIDQVVNLLNALENLEQWSFIRTCYLNGDPVLYLVFKPFGTERDTIGFSTNGRDARALSELAADALQELAQTDIK